MQLGSIARKGLRRWLCLTVTDAAAWVDGTLPPSRQARLQRHLTKCRDCRDQVGAMVRLQRSPAPAEVDPVFLARGLGVIAPARRTRPVWQWAAVAAMLSATIAGPILFRSHIGAIAHQVLSASARPSAASLSSTSPRIPTPSSNPQDVIRGSQPAARPEILQPRPNSSLSPTRTLHWQAVPQAVGYRVRLAAAGGELLWQGEVTTTFAAIPSHIRLRPGNLYFVLVRAHLPDGNSVDSAAVKFTVSPGS